MTKSGSAVLILLFFISSMLIPIQSTTAESLNTIYVDDDNTDGPWDGTIDHPFQFIRDGVNHASDGDMVFVCNGIYPERVRINTSIKLKGENKKQTIIGSDQFGSKKQNTSNGIVIISDDVTITRFSIQCCKGIFIASEKNLIYDNILKLNDVGLELSSSSYNKIYNNKIKMNGIGILSSVAYLSAEVSENNIIENNTIASNILFGIWVWSGSHLITFNDVKFNTLGVRLDGENEITCNNFYWNGRKALTNSARNEWNKNYWNRPRILPYPIVGKVGRLHTFFFDFYLVPWIQFDWHPAAEPYDIDGGGYE